MITQYQLNTEIDLTKRIYLYYWEKMANFLAIGSDKYIAWYKDLCTLYFLAKYILSINIVDGELYIGSQLVDEDYFRVVTSDVREFITYDIRDIIYTELDEQGSVKDTVQPPTPPVIITYKGFTQDWRYVVIDVLYDDLNSFTLPFALSEIDPDATRITTSLDGDPIQFVDPSEEGCHIIGNTLYFHTYYNLKAGDKIFIQYLLNIV